MGQHEYPRPQLVRDNWTSLNGVWDFAIDSEAQWLSPQQVRWEKQITVPFSPETPASGVHDTGFYRAVWYRREIAIPTLDPGHRLLLHLGAVDWEASVYLNGNLAVHHEGGYTPFYADITELLVDGPTQTIVVHALDDPHDLNKPRGKQDWVLDAHSIWYWRTTGIWQTVWMEQVPATYISRLKWTPSVVQWQLRLEAETSGAARDDLRLRLRLRHKGRTIVEDSYSLAGGRLDRRIDLPDPGIDDYRADYLWSPSTPNLLPAEIELIDGSDAVIDRVHSYTAMRSVDIHRDRFILNTRPFALRMVLDQGYWPDTGLTAPDDEALRRDVELVKEMGFNGVRLHQKIEDPRFLYWADVLGLLVWEEMPSAYAFSDKTITRLTRTWLEAMQRDSSHPCIVAWVPFNESWGVPDLPDAENQRNFVRGVYALTKAFDPTRPVIGNDGWESVATDIIAIHDYDKDPNHIARRYGIDRSDLEQMLHYERPGHRMLVLNDGPHQDMPVMLTEFGGIAYSRDKGAWGYDRVGSAADLAARYGSLLETVRSLPLLSGFCYTQFSDTYQEANGLLYMDRTPKFPIEQIAIATRGATSDAERQVLHKLRRRLVAQRHKG